MFGSGFETSTPPVAGGSAGVLYKLQGAGPPADAVRASLVVDPAGLNNALLYTAIAYGAPGNSITIEYVDPAAINITLLVTVLGSAISVRLATDGTGVITSTAADVDAAIAAHAGANALVTVVNNGGDTGAGLVTAMALTALAGGVGTGIGLVANGEKYYDTTNSVEYLNVGTISAPVWSGRLGA